MDLNNGRESKENPPTEMGGQVVTSAPAPTPTSTSTSSLSLSLAKLRILAYIMLMFRTIFICACAGSRVHQSYENKRQSPFKTNGVFKIIYYCAMSAVVAVGFILWSTNVCLYYALLRNTCYTILKFAGSFSAFLAPFMLMMVLLLPPKLVWVGYLIACVMLGMIVACLYLDDRQQQGSSILNYLVLAIVPILVLSTYFFKSNNRRILYPVICVALSIETAYHFITYVMFIIEKTRKPSSLESHRVTQQDKNNGSPRMNYLQVLGHN